MTIYNVTAWCVVPYYTTFEVEARNVREALKNAKLQAHDEHGDPCDDGAECNWEEFQIHPEDDEGKSRTFLDPARRVEIAAPDLLRAAEFALPFLSSSSDNKLERKAFRQLTKAVKKAKGGAI
jgi:hypothetical protein